MLRRQVGRTAAAVVLLGVVGLLTLLGLGLVGTGIYHWLASIWGVPAAFATVGAGCLAVALVLAYWSYRWIR